MGNWFNWSLWERFVILVCIGSISFRDGNGGGLIWVEAVETSLWGEVMVGGNGVWEMEWLVLGGVLELRLLLRLLLLLFKPPIDPFIPTPSGTNTVTDDEFGVKVGGIRTDDCEVDVVVRRMGDVAMLVG